ncbi:DUF2785 domain-containing protein [Paenibacillus antarcticus]|uniref:DUF2785 domain-containing protein n=1 Tax=Paenibacillus antarcticus TaxID=253703 RepID=A0A162PXS4_9BACL|nr:DUF2785 domain-containing protein [Paenibacillus antarcticus]OAB40260.1 hypothetical protein PBAT_23400 [Paenibacillus antarcticus]
MTSSNTQLKEKLTQIEKDEYKVPATMNAFEIGLEMMMYIGDIDPELRDNLIYSTFAEWIDRGEFTEEQVRELLHICLDEQHLFYGIGENETDSVFTRTFSVLIVPLVMGKDRDQRFLSKEEVILIKKKLIAYMNLEQDYRGYVEEKGWAHAIAHVSDGLEAIAQSPFLEREDLIDILNAIQPKFLVNNYVYINKEDERNVSAIISVFNRELLTDHEIHSWIQSFGEKKKVGNHPEDDIQYMNMKCLLRSLYFRILDQPQLARFSDTVVETLQKLDKK